MKSGTDTASLTQDLQELSVELLLAGGEDGSESISAALRTLASIVQRANEIGAGEIANKTNRLIESVASVRNTAPPEQVLPVLLNGLKTLETDLGNGSPTAAPSDSGTNELLAQDPELLQDFVVEAREHLSVMQTQLLALEQDPSNSEPTHACFRAIHTIKGVAGFLELNRIREVAHEGETLLDDVRNGKTPVTPALIDALLETADFLESEVAAIAESLSGTTRAEMPDYHPLVAKLRAVKDGESGKTAPATPADTTVALEVVPVEPLEVELAPAGPPASVNVSPAPLPKPAVEASKPVREATPARSTSASGAQKETKQAASSGVRSVKVDMEKLDYLADMVGELVVTQSMLRPEQNNAKSAQDSPFMRNLAQLARITAEVQKTAMSMRMVPIGQLFQRMSRLVRDVSRQIGKSVELELRGEEIELDRSMVEELADPLMHMVRNSIDHGIEPAEERREAGKDPTGHMLLAARHEAGQVVIEIRDDGRGLNKARILEKARQRDLISPNATLTDKEIFELIFEPGFSTAQKVTDLSGRGVGMDVVRRQIQKLRGRIDLNSVQGQGTTFLLRLPLTLAIVDGLVVAVGDQRYIVPLSTVKEVLRPADEMLYTVQGRGEMAMVRDTLFPIVRLWRRLNLRPRSEELADGILIVIEGGGKPYCLAVDELVGKQEVVIKSLGEMMPTVPGVAGGAILGDGRVGLILDPDAIGGKAAHD